MVLIYNCLFLKTLYIVKNEHIDPLLKNMLAWSLLIANERSVNICSKNAYMFIHR